MRRRREVIKRRGMKDDRRPEEEEISRSDDGEREDRQENTMRHFTCDTGVLLDADDDAVMALTSLKPTSLIG